jgi:hypothetical protein
MKLTKTIAAVFAMALAAAAHADSVKLFDAVPITSSGPVFTGMGPAQSFSEVNGAFASEVSVYVVCDAPTRAVISSTADGSGPVVVDNFLTMNGVTNVCASASPSLVQNGVAMCFSGWTGPAWDWNALDETQVMGAYGTSTVPAPAPYAPVALTVDLEGGPQLVTFERWDTGGVVASSELWLVATSCRIPSKVAIRHFANGKMLCIGNSAVQAHINHGDDIDSVEIGCGK